MIRSLLLMPSTEEAPRVCNRLRRTEPCTPSQRPDLTTDLTPPLREGVIGRDALHPGRAARPISAV